MIASSSGSFQTARTLASHGGNYGGQVNSPQLPGQGLYISRTQSYTWKVIGMHRDSALTAAALEKLPLRAHLRPGERP